MKSRKPSGSFAPHEVQRFILPITITSILIMVGLVVGNLFNNSPSKIVPIIYGCIVIASTLINNAVIVRTANFRESYGWLNAILSGIGLGLLPYVLPDDLNEISHILVPLAVIAVAIVSGRAYGYATLLAIFILDLPHLFGVIGESDTVLDFGVPYAVSLVNAEIKIKSSRRENVSAQHGSGRQVEQRPLVCGLA